ncbi:Electron transport complex protein RnfG [hydrothermal vent metagenome]|uniref:Electron transport complex protein RnfG n=1 Tax=hydrothermal vent metagenome TaxID=652676 RepID=A0A3B1BNZ9_9ZZZZ
MSTPEQPSYRSRASYHGALLGGFAMLAAALLILGDISTRDAIAERQKEDVLASLSQVLPDNLHDNDLLANTLKIDGPDHKPMTVYRALKNSKVNAVAYTMTAQGYAGDIKVLISVKKNGEIAGVRILSHAETPGLGDKIELAKSHWVLRFNGRSFANLPESKWKVKKDGGFFDQFSGATITPRGVVHAVKKGLDFFALHNNELLHADSTKTVKE